MEFDLYLHHIEKRKNIMKKLLIITTAVLMSFTGMAQSNNSSKTKQIEVNGSAEMEIVPDEISIRITLKEYKNGSKTVSMNTLEGGLVKAVNQLGLPKESLTVDNIYGYNWDWKKKKADDYLSTKSFLLKVKDVKMINDLVDKLDAEGVNGMNIAEVTHSKIEEYKMQLKIKALKSAKEKATALLASIDEEIGGAIEVQDVDFGQQAPMYRSNMMMDAKMESSGYQSNLEFKNITINAQIRAVFEIK